MKSILLTAMLVACLGVQAQAPATAPVALKDEPHHHLLFENEYARVWAFGIKGHDATLVHEHALPYLGINVGATDYMNAVTGKPEVHAKQVDGQVSYSKGGFSHLVRTETDTPFRNFTIELLKPQGAARNRCVKVIADGALDCPQTSTSALDMATTPVLETDEIVVRSGAISFQMRMTGMDAQPARLVGALENSELNVELPGQPVKKLKEGEAAWLPAGAVTSLVNPAAADSRFFLISFKDSGEKK
jgi:hypothetical protein